MSETYADELDSVSLHGAVEADTITIDSAEFAEAAKMHRFRNSTKNHLDDGDEDEEHVLGDVVTMACTCGANAVHVGDTIVCTASDEVLWDSGEFCDDGDDESDEEEYEDTNRPATSFSGP